mmetsp:Transcript_2298/g.7526  ORF Transcript_2298/g.7526 Transcript_2298/m.7526 type:complete len:477 (+) Transcript_2298:768-2198(+)
MWRTAARRGDASMCDGGGGRGSLGIPFLSPCYNVMSRALSPAESARNHDPRNRRRSVGSSHDATHPCSIVASERRAHSDALGGTDAYSRVGPDTRSHAEPVGASVGNSDRFSHAAALHPADPRTLVHLLRPGRQQPGALPGARHLREQQALVGVRDVRDVREHAEPQLHEREAPLLVRARRRRPVPVPADPLRVRVRRVLHLRLPLEEAQGHERSDAAHLVPRRHRQRRLQAGQGAHHLLRLLHRRGRVRRERADVRADGVGRADAFAFVRAESGSVVVAHAGSQPESVEYSVGATDDDSERRADGRAEPRAVERAERAPVVIAERAPVALADDLGAVSDALPGAHVLPHAGLRVGRVRAAAQARAVRRGLGVGDRLGLGRRLGRVDLPRARLGARDLRLRRRRVLHGDLRLWRRGAGGGRELRGRRRRDGPRGRRGLHLLPRGRRRREPPVAAAVPPAVGRAVVRRQVLRVVPDA